MKFTYGLLIVSTLAVCIAGLFVGHGHLHDDALRDTFLRLRTFRVAAAFIIGAALATGGVIVQALFRNPLADPSILGATAGASLGGKVTLIAFYLLPAGIRIPHILPEMMVPIGNLAGAVIALAVLLAVSRRQQGLLVVLLTGFILSSLFLSGGEFVTSLAQESWELGRALLAFTLGGVSGVGPRQIFMALPLAGFGIAAAWFWGTPLDLLLSGENEASSLGLDVKDTRRWCIIWVSLLTAAAVSIGGTLGFVGLVVPHALRPFVGVLSRQLIPAAMLAGGTFVVLCDLCVRALPTRSEVPLGVVTGLIGAPVFLALLFRLHREVQDG